MSDEISGVGSSASRDALADTVIDGRYILRRMIARGSMGKVYEAEQHPLGRTVAIKILDVREEQVQGEGFAERFLREASALARLSDLHTVRIFDFGLWEGRSYLVMEFIDGQALSQMVRHQPLPPLEALSVAMQVCSSLTEAHQLGVVHRDLKLSNILVSRRQDTGRCWAKVIDFGLVKDVVEDRSELTAVGQILGSPMYMAPEQIRAEAIDQRADLYALGVVLYRILVCERPFVQRGTPGLLFAHLNSPPRSFAEVRPDLQLPDCVEWTVMRCLEKDADDRFASAVELRRALKACRIAIEEPSLRGLTIGLRDGMTILPPELSDISSVGSLIATPGISIPALPAPAAPSGTSAARLGLLLGALVLLGLGLIGAVAVAVLVLRSPEPEPAFVPIESKPVLIEPPPAAVEPAREEPAAEVAPARRPVTAPRPSTRTPAVPASEPAAAPAPAVDALPPAPAEEAAEGEQWGEGGASDLVDPWSD